MSVDVKQRGRGGSRGGWPIWRAWGVVALAFGTSAGWGQPVAGPETPRESLEVLSASVPVATPLGMYKEYLIEGFTILADPEFERRGGGWARVRAALAFDLSLIGERLPEEALVGVRQTRIVVTRSTPPRPDWDARSAACLHVSESWLVAHGFDRERAGVVEILNADRYLLWRAEQPFMVLHELAHAHHLAIGYDDPRVIAAYRSAMVAGLYDRVAFVMEPDGPGIRAYAASNPQEYFAELTEAYFGRNDFAPFTRADLAEHDPTGFAMVEELWGLREARDTDATGVRPAP